MTRRQYYASFALLAAAAALVAWLVAHLPGAHAPPALVSDGTTGMEQVRTEIYEANALHLTATARSVRFEPAPVFGPFRIGFLRSVVASDVHIELFPMSANESPTSGLAAYVKDVGSALAQRVGSINGAELRELTITRRDPNGSTLMLLQARRCRSQIGTRAMACAGGVLREGDDLIPFGEAVHDGRSWQITRPVPRRVAAN